MESRVILQRCALSFMVLLGPFVFVGCGLFSWTKSEGQPPSPTPPSATALEVAAAGKKQSTAKEAQQELSLNGGFSLLYELMVKESDVDKILILRNASVPTQTIVHEIASACATAKEHLDTFAKLHPLLRLDYHDLPKAEVDARDAIEWATTKKLLLGVEFELKLLLTQVSATEYAAFLAQTLAARDSDKERKAWLLEIAAIFENLHRKVAQRLTVKP